MQPDLIITPFGESADPGTIRPIPESTGPSDPKQNASWEKGFPISTMTAISAGGIPPEGPDMNGVLNAISEHTVFVGGGGQYKWSAAYVAAKGGYAKGSVIQSDDGLVSYVSTIDVNSSNFNTDPSSIGVSWEFYSGNGAGKDTELRQQLNSLAGAGVSGFSQSESYDPNTVGSALKERPTNSETTENINELVSAHNNSSSAHPELTAGISADADRAEQAAQIASSFAGIYDTVDLGITATNTSDQKYFSVPSSDASEYLILYKNNSGVALKVNTYPSASAIFSQNIIYDPFGEQLFHRPMLGLGTRLCYFGTINLFSPSTPYIGKPTLSSLNSNVQRIFTISNMGVTYGNRLRFLVDVQTDLPGPILSIFFRDSTSAVISVYNTPATSSAPPAGRNLLASPSLEIPSGTFYIEVRASGAGGKIELFATACGIGSSPPKIEYSPTPNRFKDLAVTQKNMWPDPFLRQYQSGIKYQNGWGFAQLAGQAIPAYVTRSNNSPYSDKSVIRIPSGAGQHDMNIDAGALGLKLGSKITFVLSVYSAQSVNLSIFGRNSSGGVVGDSSNTSYTWANGAALYEIRKSITVDQVMLDTVKFFQVRLLNGQTVGSTPIEICARGVFVGETDPLLFDDAIEDDKRSIQINRIGGFGNDTLCETQERLAAITFGSSFTKQYSSAHIGDSFTHLPQRWMQPFATYMQSRYGNDGPGWIGFGNPDSGSGNINGQNWQGISITVTGSWSSSYSSAPGPDICSVSSSDTGSQYRVNNIPAGISSARLYAPSAMSSMEYSVDGGSIWTTVDLSSDSGLSIVSLTIPSSGFNLWVRPKSGNCTVYGVQLQKSEGHVINKLGATGSSASQWASQTSSQIWKDSISSLNPNFVSVLLGTNDQTSSTAPWVFGGYIESIIKNIRSAVPLADIAVLMPAENQRSNNVSMAAYSSVVREICYRLNIAYHDLQQDYGISPIDYASTSARSWYSPDLIHPNPATDGGIPIAARLVKILKGGL